VRRGRSGRHSGSTAVHRSARSRRNPSAAGIPLRWAGGRWLRARSWKKDTLRSAMLSLDDPRWSALQTHSSDAIWVPDWLGRLAATPDDLELFNEGFYGLWS